MALTLSRTALLRLMRALLLAELAATTRRGLSSCDAAAWPDDLSLGEDGLALGRAERLACAAAVIRFFQMPEAESRRDLLNHPRLEDWAQLVAAVLASGTTGITVTNFAGDGAARHWHHGHDALLGEATFWASCAQGCDSVMQLVPAHHIYGLVFTILLPELLGVPVVDGRALPPRRLRAALEGGCLVVGHPTGLARLARTVPQFPPGVRVTSSIARLPSALHTRLAAQGAAEVIDIYGRAPTGAIACRSTADAPFHLLPRWQPGARDQASIIDAVSGLRHDLPDQVEWCGARALRLLGRRDMALPLAGGDVYPDAVAAALRQHPSVRHCAVRLDVSRAAPGLYALIVPEAGIDPAEAAREVEAWCRERFSPAECPMPILPVDMLPRNALGKPLDWQDADRSRLRAAATPPVPVRAYRGAAPLSLDIAIPEYPRAMERSPILQIAGGV